MLDLFTIFSKGGIVLWCFQSTKQIFTPSVNALIRTVILQVSTRFALTSALMTERAAMQINFISQVPLNWKCLSFGTLHALYSVLRTDSSSKIRYPSVTVTILPSLSWQERTGNQSFDHDSLTLKYKLDNEFELVFVVAFQKILQLSYVDKFLNDIHLEFRDKYKEDLRHGRYFQVRL